VYKYVAAWFTYINRYCQLFASRY